MLATSRDVGELTLDLPTIDDVRAARARIAPFVHRTPTVSHRSVSERIGTNIHLKLEMFQRTGAFKVRGAFNRMLTLTESERRRGVVAVSAGNHGQAVACAARQLGLRAVVLMPESTPLNYLSATAAYGATIDLVPSLAEAMGAIPRYLERGLTYIHPFADRLVIAGQGTIGLELLEEVPNLTDVVVSIGGGGLAGGIALAVKSVRPEVRVWGVETEGAESMAVALAAGRVVELPRVTSIACTLCAHAVAEETLVLAQRYLESVTVVSDASAVEALRFLLERTKVLAEPASSCTLAAAERLREHFTPESHVALVLCGGNVSAGEMFGAVA
ncbi:MAG: threonine ammonia-lyase [Chloroflexota bacterium]